MEAVFIYIVLSCIASVLKQLYGIGAFLRYPDMVERERKGSEGAPAVLLYILLTATVDFGSALEAHQFVRRM